MGDRILISSGTPWEEITGYSRVVRVGNIVHVSGTTASDENGKVYGVGDVAEQTRYILNKISNGLEEAGASLRDVVRTRMYVVNMAQWHAVAEVHGEFFRDIRPVSTLVEVSRLVSPEHLIEIEVEAIVQDTSSIS